MKLPHLYFLLPLTAALIPPQQHLLLGHLPIMSTPKPQPSVPLNDILPTHRSLTTFSSFARLHTSTSTLLSSMDSNTTVLAPLNSAIEDLPRKPWEAPNDRAEVYEGEEGREKAQQNLLRFVEAHLVGRSPWKEGEKTETLGGGRKIWWEEKDGKKVIMPDEVEVDKVASQVGNGEVWMLKGVLNYV